MPGVHVPSSTTRSGAVRGHQAHRSRGRVGSRLEHGGCGQPRRGAEDRVGCRPHLAGRWPRRLAAMAYRDALRLGAPSGPRRRPLDELSASHRRSGGGGDGRSRTHARARRSSRMLAAAADGFESVGVDAVHAAEAMADASRHAAEAGLRSSGRRLSCSCRPRLATVCGPTLTPRLEPISGREALSSLTRKEQEVALMAARGMTNATSPSRCRFRCGPSATTSTTCTASSGWHPETSCERCCTSDPGRRATDHGLAENVAESLMLL